jgi:membrane peptidoglycan carboxypeptidase
MTTQNPVIRDDIRQDMVAMLCHVIEAGTGTAARLAGRDAAGKTGTTQEYRDAWFIGFTAGHVAGVWIGNDDNRPMRKVTGGTAPAQMWKAVMLAAETGMPVMALERSPGPPAGTEPEEVAVTAYSDDPMQGSTFVTPTTPRTPDMVVSTAAPVIPPQVGEEASAALASQAQTPQVPRSTPDWVITRVPYQAYARAAPPPVIERPSEPTAPAPDTSYRPPGTVEADAYSRRQRELDYWRMRREAMRPIPDEDRSYRGSEFRREAPLPSEEVLPFPASRERADRPD